MPQRRDAAELKPLRFTDLPRTSFVPCLAPRLGLAEQLRGERVLAVSLQAPNAPIIRRSGPSTYRLSRSAGRPFRLSTSRDGLRRQAHLQVSRSAAISSWSACALSAARREASGPPACRMPDFEAPYASSRVSGLAVGRSLRSRGVLSRNACPQASPSSTRQTSRATGTVGRSRFASS